MAGGSDGRDEATVKADEELDLDRRREECLEESRRRKGDGDLEANACDRVGETMERDIEEMERDRLRRGDSVYRLPEFLRWC